MADEKYFLDFAGLQEYNEEVQAQISACASSADLEDLVTPVNITVSASGGSGGPSVTVDTSITESSTNPVESAAIYLALSGKANSSHTHSISNVTGLQSALDGKASSSHTHSIDDLTDFDPSTIGSGNVVDIVDDDESILDSDGVADLSDYVKNDELSSAVTPVTLNVTAAGGGSSDIDVDTEITSSSTNPVTSASIYTALAGKAASSHTHSISNITNLQSSLNGKADTSHTHSIEDITDFDISAIGGGVVKDVLYDGESILNEDNEAELDGFATTEDLESAVTPVNISVTTEAGAITDLDTSVISGSENAVSGGAVYTELQKKTDKGTRTHFIEWNGSDSTKCKYWRIEIKPQTLNGHVCKANSIVVSSRSQYFIINGNVKSSTAGTTIYEVGSKGNDSAPKPDSGRKVHLKVYNAGTTNPGTSSFDKGENFIIYACIDAFNFLDFDCGEASFTSTELTTFTVQDWEALGSTLLQNNDTESWKLATYKRILSTSDLDSTYLSKSLASSTYLTQSSASSTYATKASVTALESSLSDLDGYVKQEDLEDVTAPVNISISPEFESQALSTSEVSAMFEEASMPEAGVKIIREQNVDTHNEHEPGWYQFSYPFLTSDTVRVWVNGVETTDFETLPYGYVHLGDSFSAPYPEHIEAQYKLVTRLEQVCTVPFRNNSFGLWYRAYDELKDSLYLSWDGTCGTFEAKAPLKASLARAEISLEWTSFHNGTAPKSIFELGCDEFHESFKMYIPSAALEAAISTLEDRWDDHLSSWLQVTEIKFPSIISMHDEGKSFTCYISWRRGGAIYFGARDLDYTTDEHYEETGYVIPDDPYLYFPTDQWVEVEIAVKAGPKGVGYLSLRLTDEEGNEQYYKENTIDYCPSKMELASPLSPKSQMDMPKAISMYMDRYIFDAIAACDEPYWKLKDFTCSFYSHNKD